MEASITNSKASKFTDIFISIFATLNGISNKVILEQHIIEIARVSADITNKVTDFRSNILIRMLD